jgi:hypothetical protein
MTDVSTTVPRMPKRLLSATTGAGVIRSGFDRGTRAPRAGERALLGFLLPPWQRLRVWTPEQNLSLIESIWYELPIGSYVVNTDFRAPHYPFDNYLIDGQQRWSAIADYCADRFPVFGATYSQLHLIDKRRFNQSVFPCIEISVTEEAELKSLYDRLAYGGTAHDPDARQAS